MMPNIDPKKMQAMMKQMGISQEEIDATRVIIERDEGNIIIDNPSVVKVKMSGQESFQISGDIIEETGVSEADIDIVMQKTGATKDEAKKALEDADGDLTEAILILSS